jgi:hypothetical protein
MIDITTEQLITLEDAAARIPPGRGGRPCNPSTVYRWILSRKLEGTRIGNRWLTSVEALQRHSERETLAVLGAKPAPQIPVQTKGRRKAIERAEREAELIGI